jgi:hypothetical protein
LIKGNYAFIGDPSLSTGDNSSSAVVIFRKEKDEWTHYRTVQEKLQVGKTYGKTIAHSRSILFVGDDVQNKIYLYHKSEGYRFKFDELTPEYPLKQRNYGRSIVSTDDYLFVSYVQKAQGINGAKGCVDVYHHKGSLWFKVDEIRSPDNFDVEGFGSIMDVQNNMLAISSNKSIANNKKGSVYVYQLNGQSWEYQQQIAMDSPRKMNGFGYAIKLAGDKLFISESQLKKFNKKDDKYDFQRENFFLGGKVYCYSNDLDSPTDYSLDTILRAPQGEEFNGFGSSITTIDNKLFIGAYQGIAQKGKVFLYELGCNEGWNLRNIVKSSNPVDEKQFGFSIFASKDELLIGAKRASYNKGDSRFNPENIGKAYFYSYLKEKDFVGQLTEVHLLQYTAPSGKKFYKSQDFIDTITKKDGCDSLIRIDLTIINTDAFVLDAAGDVVQTIAVTPTISSDKEIKKTKFIKRIEVDQPFIKLEYFDQGTVDNDTVSIKFNDNWLVLDKELTKEKNYIVVQLEEGENSIIFRAENVGTEYPNTSRVVVYNQDGKLISYANMKSNMDESSFLIINYKPKKD